MLSHSPLLDASNAQTSEQADAGVVLDHTWAPQASEIRFVRPILGFPHLQRFWLVEVEETGTLFRLRSAEPEDSTSFIVARAAALFADYAPLVSDSDADALGARDEDKIGCLLMVNAPEGSLSSATVNLRAPLLIDVETGAALQALTVDEWPTQAAMFR